MVAGRPAGSLQVSRDSWRWRRRFQKGEFDEGYGLQVTLAGLGFLSLVYLLYALHNEFVQMDIRGWQGSCGELAEGGNIVL